MRESVDNGNSKTEYTDDGYRIEIPSKKQLFVTAFLVFWLMGWLFGEVTVLTTLLSGDIEPFLLVWILGWTVGGGFALFIVLWMLFGKEVITSNGEFLSISKEISGIKHKREYEIRSIKNLKVHVETQSLYRRRGLEYYGLSGGVLQFDYGMKTIKMGINLDEAEGRYLKDTVLRDLPSYTY